MRHKDYRQLLDELRSQGWDVEQTTQGHWKAVPPDKAKSVVHFSTSADAHALKNALSDLKRSGLIWPPPTRSTRDGAPKSQDEWWNTEQEASSSKPEPPPSKSEERLAEGHEERMDRVYGELKEAKVHLALADEILEECRVKLAKAQAAFDEATTDRENAATMLREKKAAFDRAFGEAA